MRKAILPLLLALAFLAAGCFRISWPLPPAAGGSTPTTRPVAGRLPVYLDSVDLLQLESWPVQVRAVVRGTLPTPCHTLAWSLSEPDAEGRIFLDVYSTVDLDRACIEVLQPFERTIDIGSFTGGSYRLVVNGIAYPFTV